MVKVDLNLVSVSWSSVLSISPVFTHLFPYSFLSLVSYYFYVLGEKFPSPGAGFLGKHLLFTLKSSFIDFGTFYHARKKWSIIEDRQELVVSLPPHFRSPVWFSYFRFPTPLASPDRRTAPHWPPLNGTLSYSTSQKHLPSKANSSFKKKTRLFLKIKEIATISHIVFCPIG